MVFNALCHLHHNELNLKARGGAPKFYVEDNVDPVRMKALLDVIEPEKTCFNVISKSGATSETMTQYLIISDALERAGVDIAKNMIFTTDASRGNLNKIDRERSAARSKSTSCPTAWAADSPSSAPWAFFPRPCSAST